LPEGSDPKPSPRPPPAGGGTPRPAGGSPQIGNLPLSAVAVIGIAVALLVWLLFIRGDDDDDPGGAAGPAIEKTVEVVSASALPKAVAPAGYPVYWLGPRPNVDYEVTLITDGRTYVRYLPKGEEAETETPYLTVGSYLQQDALRVLEQLAGTTESIAGGGRALKQGEDGVYVAFPGVDTQIEVYDPRPGRALELVRSGAVVSVR
jgi:hypothetical protein